MGFLDFLSGSTSKNVNMNTRRHQAAQKAYYKTKQKYGRAPQSRVANIARTPGTFQRTNEAAIYQENLTQQFIQDLGAEVRSFGPIDKVKNALVSLIYQLDQGIHSNRIILEVPVVVGKLLRGILKVIVISLGIFYSAAMILAGASGNANIGTAFGATVLGNTLGTAIGATLNNNRRRNVAVEEWSVAKRRKTRRNRK